jgi:nucleotide-binding universal stress UspA family protein/sporulation protein YlmC with PRC-barrel domain
MKEQGLQVDVLAPYAPAAQAIVYGINVQRADLVVMCTHGRSGLGRWVYGSVAEAVLAQSPVPVLLLRPVGPPPVLVSKTGPASLLVPLDGSAFGEVALAHAAALARTLSAPITLLRALAWPMVNYGAIPWCNEAGVMLQLNEFEAVERADAESYLAGVAAHLRKDGVHVKQLVGMGWPPDVICRESERAGAGIIVMATRAGSEIEPFGAESVAVEVVRCSTLPVLLVPSAPPDQAGVGTAQTSESRGRYDQANMERGETAVKIQVNALIECQDGLYGRCSSVVVDPKTRQLTHLVARRSRPPHAERLVPADRVAATTTRAIILNCTKKDVAAMESYLVERYTRMDMPDDYEYAGYAVVLASLAAPEATRDGMLHVTTENVPDDKLVVHRGARVEATDGPVGQVDELIVDPKSQQITHVAVRKGPIVGPHVLGPLQVVIPIAQVDIASSDTVYLKLDKQAFEALPATPAGLPRPPLPL